MEATEDKPHCGVLLVNCWVMDGNNVISNTLVQLEVFGNCHGTYGKVFGPAPEFGVPLRESVEERDSDWGQGVGR